MAQRKVLVVQFAVREGDTLEAFHAIEEVLFQAFEQNRFAVVDGHDYGEGRFNIYIYPRAAWGPVIERVEAFLKLKGWLARATIAKGLASGKWQVIWPEGFAGAFRL
jgi:hypothetical protein